MLPLQSRDVIPSLAPPPFAIMTLLSLLASFGCLSPVEGEETTVCWESQDVPQQK